MKLKQVDVRKLLDEVLHDIPRDDCWTCDCFLGYVTQMELDSVEDVRNVTAQLKPPKAQIHGCMGCDPCPPAIAYSNYVRGWNLETKTEGLC